MGNVDLNLLVVLDALLAEGSVTGAARRLHLSASAMSRALARLRATTGDPLLVRAGRGLVPTPRAVELRERVRELTRGVQAVLRPQTAHVDPRSLELTFTVRVSEAFMEYLAGPVVAAVARNAPRVCLHFAPKPDKDGRPLRERLVDLEIGVPGTSAPEIRTRLLFHDRFVGLARVGHPLLANTPVTPRNYAACDHVVASKEGKATEPIAAALEAQRLARAVKVIVPGYPDAMRIARESELVALVPRSCLGNRSTDELAATSGLATFELPVPVPGFKVLAMWHPRLDADPAHRWLRDTIRSVCHAAYPQR